MGKSKQKKILKGVLGFESYYADLYGDRWPYLKEALGKEPLYVEWKSLNESNQKSYYLDAGSVLAAFSLPFDSHKDGPLKILDMCAAPGGKSLVLASRLSQKALESSAYSSWELTSNERSNERRMRLVRNMREQLSQEVYSHTHVTGFDAARWCTYEQESFDYIFVDAPCSSERHVLSSKKHLEQWSPSRVKNLAQTQWSILSSAFRVLRHGGYLVYATCALSPLENDGVVKRLSKKFDVAKVCSMDYTVVVDGFESIVKRNTCEYYSSFMLPSFERTEFGYHVLPDVTEGAGPLYFSIIKKI